ncbi:MAG: NADH-ubiquinone oxidoreductase-F iron-sulfur binding region domain-containing protein [Nitrospinota bacterium]
MVNNISGDRFLLPYDIHMNNLHSVETIYIDKYLSMGGYNALAKTLKELKPEDVIEEVKRSGLRGRGGAGFPTGQKWELVAGALAEEKYLCCNAAEGEPGTFKDRCLIHKNPHQLIEGVIITSYAIGAYKSYIYINEDHQKEIMVIERALKEAKENGYIGEKILGGNFSLDIYIHKCPNKYVAGEETAMIEVIEGRAAKPWQKPPYYPAKRGLYGKPTLVNNTETLSNIPTIILRGGKWFSRLGTKKSPGTMLFTLSGDVNRPGVYELPLGTTMRELINNCGNGLKDRMGFKAAFPSGPSNSPIKESQLDIPLDFDSLKDAGSGLGCAGVIVVGDNTCIVDTVMGFSRFFMEESCGQCPVCQMGTNGMFRLLQKIEDGHGGMDDLHDIEGICSPSNGKGYCHLITGATLVVEGTIRNFREEFEKHIHERKCPLQGNGRQSFVKPVHNSLIRLAAGDVQL